jgi:hypothetical protein
VCPRPSPHSLQQLGVDEEQDQEAAAISLQKAFMWILDLRNRQREPRVALLSHPTTQGLFLLPPLGKNRVFVFCVQKTDNLPTPALCVLTPFPLPALTGYDRTLPDRTRLRLNPTWWVERKGGEET